SAVGNFKTKFGLNPPSRIKLCSLESQYNTTQQLDVDSLAFMKHMFPRCDTTWATTGINWLPNLNQSPNGVTLEGEECLVFFLGGVQTNAGGTNGCLGFSTTPTSPMDTSDPKNRIGPFAQFQSTRLVMGPSGAAFMYNDPYGTPYAFFSSYKTRNGYNRYGTP